MTARRRHPRALTTQPAERPTPTVGATEFAALLAAAYLIAAWIGMLRHEMWRDEWQAWILASRSGSIAELFSYLREESHLPLWPLCLFGLSRTTPDPRIMQGFHVVIATLSVFVFARFAPFSRLSKVAFSLGYFTLFEYGIISRNYAVGILAALLFCVAFVRGKDAAAILFLAVLGASSQHGLLAAAPLFGLVLWRLLRESPPSASRRWLIAEALACVAGLAILAAELVPWDEVHRRLEVSAPTEQARIVRTVNTVWNGYAPLPNVVGELRWDTNLLPIYNQWGTLVPRPGLLKSDPLTRPEWVAFYLSLAILIWAAVTLSGNRRILITFLAIQSLLLLLFHFIYHGWARHHGFLFAGYVLCLWLARESTDSGARTGRRKAPGRVLVAVVLVMQSISGVFWYVADLVRPFTVSPQVADYIRKQRFDKIPILASPDYVVAPVAATLGKKLRSLETGTWVRFIGWKAFRDLDATTVVRRIGAILRKARRDIPFLLVTSYPVEAVAPPPKEAGSAGARIQITPLAVFPPGLVPDEQYILYFLQVPGEKVPERIRSLAIRGTRWY